MTQELRIGLLALAAILVLAALLGGRVLRDSWPAHLRIALRAAVGVLGVALVAWVLPGYLGSRAAAVQPPPPPAPRSAHAMPVDLVQLASTELGACALPSAPAVPDGAHASREQMNSASDAFKAYDAATLAYTNCVDAAIERIAAQHGGAAADADVRRLRAFGESAHNVAIDEERAVADKFNTQIRTYKSKPPN